jgi:hypothetical protein
MLDNMNPREKKLLYATVAAVVLFGAWQFGLGDAIGGGGSSSGSPASASGAASVEREERLFRNNLQTLQDLYEVNFRYSRIGSVPGADRPDLPPRLAFTQEVYDISQKLGFQFPALRANGEDIEGVDEYELLSVAVRTNGSFKDTVALLRAYDEAGFIFRELDLRASRDRDIIETTVVVARIAERPQRRTTTGNARLNR